MIDKILKDSWTGRINKTFPNTTQKEKFSIIDFFSNLVTFTEEILNGQLHFFEQCNFVTISFTVATTVKI